MLEQIRTLLTEYETLQTQLGDPGIALNPAELKRIGKRMAELDPVLPLAREYEQCRMALREVERVKNDPELLEIAEEDAKKAKQRLPALEEQLRVSLVPKDPDDDRSIILEIRAGTGGEEAALFAAELLRMYLRYAEAQGWNTTLLSTSDAEAGGIKEAIVRIGSSTALTAGSSAALTAGSSAALTAGGAYGKLKFESGVHRVQRIPVTESKGRLHTSAASVAILPEAEEVDIVLRPEDLRVDTFRAGGAGGQHVNKTESAVRITHLPTGTVVTCQSERSQMQNRASALELLRSRLFAAKQERLAKGRGELRAGQVGSGDRSEKIRTYNYPQDRVTDHRIKRNFGNLRGILDGQLGEVIEALQEAARDERFKTMLYTERQRGGNSRAR